MKKPKPVVLNKKLAALLKQGKREPMPKDIEPMLATLVTAPAESGEWVYEMKWDGYRALAYLNGGHVELRSRNNKSFDEKFYPVRQELLKWKINAVVDGEVLVLNDNFCVRVNEIVTAVEE